MSQAQIDWANSLVGKSVATGNPTTGGRQVIKAWRAGISPKGVWALFDDEKYEKQFINYPRALATEGQDTMSVWTQLDSEPVSEGAIARTTQMVLSQSRIDPSGGTDRDFQEIGEMLDQAVSKMNTGRVRNREYDRSEPVDDKKVAVAWKKVLDVLAGAGV